MTFTDVIFSKADGVAQIRINRPQVLNSFRSNTVSELIQAFKDVAADRSIGVVVLGGAGDRAFCCGRDNNTVDTGGKGKYSGIAADDLYAIVRDVPQPVIARIQGYAIGGGNVLAALCDLTIASDKAVFGQVGPRVGAVDPGWGTAYLSTLVGEKKAREMWYLCRRYNSQEALQMGLCNAVVPHDKLDEEIDRWCKEILANSPTAITLTKRSFVANTENIRGIEALGKQALRLYRDTEESKEGTRAFLEKRKPEFRRYV
jgi:2-ketocyclohexanecarboxyl-CoA hydrolase